MFGISKRYVFNVSFEQQAFSHFTFERSGHQMIVVDIQGVGDIYTDPQIHTARADEYGDANLGKSSFQRFYLLFTYC